MSGSFVDNGYRGTTSSPRPRSTGLVRRRPVPRVRVRRPAHAGDPRAVHLAHRPHAPPPLWALGLPPVPVVRLHPGRGRGDRPAPPGRRDPLRRAVARHRVHGRLPRLHLGPPTASRTRTRCWSGCGEQGFRVITIIDPGVKHDPGYAVFDDGRRAGRVLPHRGRRPLHRPGVARQHRVPRLRHRGGARAGGASSTPRTCASGLAGIWNDMNEPATGDIPSAADAVRPRHGLARAVPQPVRPADGDGHHGRAAGRRCPTCAPSCCPAPASRGSSGYAANWMGDNLSRWDHLWREHRRWARASGCPASPSSVPTSAASRAAPTPSCSCAGCSTAR